MQHSGAAETTHMEAKTSVWWDIENSPVTEGSDAHAILQNIRSALVKMKYHGEVFISVYGDVSRIPSSVQQALSGAGVALNHVPAGIEDAIHKKILVDMLFWAVDNPAPANYLLISGDTDFFDILHQLHLRRYNIFLAKNLSSGKSLENSDHKTNLENKQVKDINGNGDCGENTALNKAPHEYFKVAATSRSNYNMQIIPLGEIHRNGSTISNGKPCCSEQVEDLVRVILLTLETLREEMVIPTESNIIDCIRCCSGGPEGYAIVDINKGLHNALKQYKVVNISLGSFELFVLRGQKLWSCINPIGGNARDYPETTWNRIRSFLLSSSGRSAIYTSNTRYEAAFILKRACLEELKVGSVLQILNIIFNEKRWISHHPSGWQPITINLNWLRG